MGLFYAQHSFPSGSFFTGEVGNVIWALSSLCAPKDDFLVLPNIVPRHLKSFSNSLLMRIRMGSYFLQLKILLDTLKKKSLFLTKLA